jgi:leucyl aminopeptidase
MRNVKMSQALLAQYAVGVVLLPVAPSKSDWAALPAGKPLAALHSRKPRKAGDFLALRVGRDAATLLIAGFVAKDSSTFERLKAAAKFAAAALEAEPRKIALWSCGLSASSADSAIMALLAAVQAAAFSLPVFKSKPAPRTALSRIDIVAVQKSDALAATVAGAAGNNVARWLTALPPNELDARQYRALLKRYAQRQGFGFRFYDENQLRRMGAGAFVAVAQGNARRDAGIAHLTYRPRGSRAPIALVGKGICFDTGGTNLKAHKGMLDMHMDMEGSAVALGSLHALGMLRWRQPIDCWLAITENRTSATAYKPQDLIRALNGTTIQTIHTDAEGRMVLADTLCLASRKKPKAIIDYATLTGACVYALTERYSGAFTNRVAARELIEAAGSRSGERVWCFPMDDDFDSDIDSRVADIAQCAVEGKGDHILAARFLSRFVPASIPWLHIDLAAGWRQGGLAHIGTDITGFGVRYTLELLRQGWPPRAKRA